MTAESLQSSPMTGQEKKRVIVNTNRNVLDYRGLSASKQETKLLFHEAAPACTSNRATCVNPPTSIVIEKLLPVSEEQRSEDSTKSSITFTTLSEEQLHTAVKLAKRDLRRRRLESLYKSPPKYFEKASLLETSDVEVLQELGATPSKVKLKASSPKNRVAKPRGIHTHKTLIAPRPCAGQSPPTREHDTKLLDSLNHEIYRLQHELEVCIQKAEELATQEEKEQVCLDPDEQSKLNTRKQKQAARFASNIYSLKQQVKEIQEHLEKKQCQKTKSTAVHRLAAVYRRAISALHVYIQQLSDTTQCNSPPIFKDLGQLIRQLCLCSAKVTLNEGSPVPQSTLDILQKLEILDSAIGKQNMFKKMQVQACPPHRESDRSTSPINALQGTNPLVHQAAYKPVKPARNINSKKMALKKTKAVSYAHRDLLRAFVERLVQQREQGKKHEGPLKHSTCNKRGTHHGKIPSFMMRNGVQNAGFHQPTVSSRIRVNQVPQKEQSVPWIPTSPHSPRRPRPLHEKLGPEPRCLFSPERKQLHNLKVADMFSPEPSLNPVRKHQAQEEALREVWLDKMTQQRLKELRQLSEEETQRQILRSKVISPTRWAERAEQIAIEKIQPLLDQAQQFGESIKRTAPPVKNRLTQHAVQRSAQSAEQLSEALVDDLLEETAREAWAVETDRQLEGMAQRRLQTSTLENMLLRMEEIQKDQEEVRRRVTSIIYSDPLNWDNPNNTGKSLGSRPSSPQPIRLTRPVLKQNPAAEIILEKPLETVVFSETGQKEEVSQEEQQIRSSTMFPITRLRSRGAVLSVPSNTLRSIRQYREHFEAHRSAVAHKSVGGITPWAIADSLAEELLSEALADVAAEFQDVVEEYAEAVFTSEFLEPVPSPAPSAQAITRK